jgi:hypothetical protein
MFGERGICCGVLKPKDHRILRVIVYGSNISTTEDDQQVNRKNAE